MSGDSVLSGEVFLLPHYTKEQKSNRLWPLKQHQSKEASLTLSMGIGERKKNRHTHQFFKQFVDLLVKNHTLK